MAKRKDADKPIGMVPIQVLGCRCRCGHEWVAQGTDRPRVCPKCKSELGSAQTVDTNPGKAPEGSNLEPE